MTQWKDCVSEPEKLYSEVQRLCGNYGSIAVLVAMKAWYSTTPGITRDDDVLQYVTRTVTAIDDLINVMLNGTEFTEADYR